jgi:hypothetical protein
MTKPLIHPGILLLLSPQTLGMPCRTRQGNLSRAWWMERRAGDRYGRSHDDGVGTRLCDWLQRLKLVPFGEQSCAISPTVANTPSPQAEMSARWLMVHQEKNERTKLGWPIFATRTAKR